MQDELDSPTPADVWSPPLRSGTPNVSGIIRSYQRIAVLKSLGRGRRPGLFLYSKLELCLYRKDTVCVELCLHFWEAWGTYVDYGRCHKPLLEMSIQLTCTVMLGVPGRRWGLSEFLLNVKTVLRSSYIYNRTHS